MTSNEIRSAVLAALCDVAPEIDAGAVRDDDVLRETFDLDSMDFLNFLVGVDQRVGVEVPEADYELLETLADIVTYVTARTPAA